MLNLPLAQLGMDMSTVLLSTFKPILFFYILPILPLTFLLLYAIVLWLKKSEDKEEDKKDNLLGFKVGVYLLEIVVFHLVVLSVFMFFDFILSKMTSQAMPTDFLKSSFALLLGSVIMLVVLEFILIKIDVAKNFIVRKVSYSIALFILGFFAVFFTTKFLGSIIEFPKGAAFHVPFAGTLVYLPLFIFGSVYYAKTFKEDTGKNTFLPASLINMGNQMMNKAAPGGAMGMPANFGAVPSQQQYSQPMQQQPMQQQYSQPMQQQPMQQQPMQQQPQASGQICPTCGGNARYIQQYNRYYCDSCKKYL